MISKASRQPQGLHWEIRMHPAPPWKREQPEAFHCPHPSSNEPASKCFQSCWKIVLLVKRAAEKNWISARWISKTQGKGQPTERSPKGPFGLGRSRICAGWQVQLTGRCRAARKWGKSPGEDFGASPAHCCTHTCLPSISDSTENQPPLGKRGQNKV